jgi:protein SCO1/2
MSRRWLTLLAACVAVLALAEARAQAIGPPPPVAENVGPVRADEVPPELLGMDVLDKRGSKVPGDLMFVEHTGKPVRLGDLMSNGKPTVLVMAYFTCPGLCTAVLNDMVERMRSLDFTVGKDFNAIVVGFDPRDSAELAGKKRDNYLAEYGRAVPPTVWPFLVPGGGGHGDALDAPGTPQHQLADALGFQYRWDARTQRFGHPGVLFVLSPSGVLSQAIPAQNSTRDLRLALLDASEGKLGSFLDHAFARCFAWDPNAKGYRVVAMEVFKIVGGVVLFLVVLLLTFLWRAERKRRPAPSPASVDGPTPPDKPSPSTSWRS